MTRLRPAHYLSVFFLFIIIASCQKEKSFETGLGPASNSWSFSEAGNSFAGQMDSAYYVTQNGGQAFLMLGSKDAGAGIFFLALSTPGGLKTGTFSSPDVFFEYIANGAVQYASVPSDAGQFSVTISRVLGNRVDGSFSGSVLDTAGLQKHIDAGSFSASIQ